MNHKSWMVHRNEKGIILVISLMVLLAMTALGMMVFYSSAVDFKMAGNERASRVAYYAAQSGLVDAKKRLEENSPETTGYAGYCKPGPTGDVTNPDCDLLDPAWQLPNGLINGTLPNGSSYEVSITHVGLFNASGWYVKRGDDSDHWPYYRITSTGTYLSSSKTLEEYTYLNVVDTWDKAVIACDNLVVAANGGTDSFDSDSSLYNGASQGLDGDIFVDGEVSLENNSGFNGSIESTGLISMKQNSIINGSLTSGSTISIESGTKIWGNVKSSLSATPSITVEKPGSLLAGDFTTSGTVSDIGNRITGTILQYEPLAAIESPEACDPENWLPKKAANHNDAITMTKDMDGTWDCQQDWDQCLIGGCCRLCPNNVTVKFEGGPDEAHPYRYRFDRLTTDQNVTLVTTGYVEIYVNGDIIIDSGSTFCGHVDPASECYVQYTPTVHYPHSPAEELLLYGYGESRDADCNPLGTRLTVKVLNNSHVFGKIYAPESSNTLINNNAHVYGAVVAGGMSYEEDTGGGGGGGAGGVGGLNNNAMVHYDAAIANTTTRNATVMVDSRKECYYGTLTSDYITANEYFATGACRLTSPP